MTQTSGPTAEERFGAEVKTARETRGWTQERLRRLLDESSGIDLSQTAMTRLEQGKRPIRLNEAAALSQLLGLDLGVYGGALPQLTEEEYGPARKYLGELRQQEERIGRDLLSVTTELEEKRAVIEEAKHALSIARGRLETQLKAYEDRRGG